MTFNERLKKSDFTQQEFADKLGCTRRNVSYWLAGDTKPNSLYLETIRTIKGFENINLENIDAVIAIGVVAIFIGLLALFVSIVIEQQKGKKKVKEEIKKEDLEP